MQHWTYGDNHVPVSLVDLNTLITLTNKLIDVVARPAQNVRRKVRNAGGKVLYMEWERIRDEAIEQGLEEGRVKGRAEANFNSFSVK